jgi:hypothetical protein
MLLDPDSKELVIKATHRSQRHITETERKLERVSPASVAGDNKPIGVLECPGGSRYVNRDIARKEGLCSLAASPWPSRAG